MSDVQVWFRAPSGNGKTWLAVNAKAFFEQMGFQVSSITEGKSCDVMTIREPVPVITAVARGRSLVAALTPPGALPYGIERIERLPQAHNAVEVIGGVHCTGHVDYDKTTPPIQANHVSLNTNTGDWELGLVQKSMSNKEFEQEYLLEPTPGAHPDYVGVKFGMRGYFAVYMKWSHEHGGFYEPWNTGETCATFAEAAADAKQWAASENVEYRKL